MRQTSTALFMCMFIVLTPARSFANSAAPKIAGIGGVAAIAGTITAILSFIPLACLAGALGALSQYPDPTCDPHSEFNISGSEQDSYPCQFCSGRAHQQQCHDTQCYKTRYFCLNYNETRAEPIWVYSNGFKIVGYVMAGFGGVFVFSVIAAVSGITISIATEPHHSDQND